MFLLAGDDGHGLGGYLELDAIRIIRVEQITRLVVERPASGFVDADQNRFIALWIQGGKNALGGLQRDFVLGRFAAEDDADAGFRWVMKCPGDTWRAWLK